MRTAVLLLSAIVLAGGSAAAQDDPRFGITMAYPASIGAIWRAGDRLALRPDVTFSRTSNESETTLTIPGIGTRVDSTTSDLNQVSVGASALFYVTKREALRTYVSPRAAYMHSSSTFAITVPELPATSLTSPSTTSGYLVSGSIGAEYALGTRFAIFGESGIAYQHLNPPSSAATSIGTVSNTQTSTSLGLRAGVGVILYLR